MITHGNHLARRATAVLLQATIVVIGLTVLAGLLVEPQFEGRNVGATLIEVYFNDPFLAYVYLASIPFFVALFQAYKGLGYIGRNEVFSQAAVRSLRIIKYCGLIVAGSVMAASTYIRLAADYRNDDPAGAIMLGVIITFMSVVVTAVAAVCQKVLQIAVDLRSEHDLTV